jgi:hypothetical protein
MSEPSDNPYAAPQSSPEEKPRVPLRAYFRASWDAFQGLIVGLFVAGGVITLPWVVASAYLPLPLPSDSPPSVQFATGVLCIFVGVAFAVHCGMRELRH